MVMPAPPQFDGVPEPLPVQEITVLFDPNTGQFALRSTVPDPFQAIGYLHEGIYILLKRTNGDTARGAGPPTNLLVAAGSLPPAPGRGGGR